MTVDAVYHLADAGRVERGLRNVANLLDDVGQVGGEQLGDVVVVAHADAVTKLRADAAVADTVAGLLADGVTITACANSLESAGLARDDLVDGVAVAPSAQTVLIRRQAEGYAYVRP